MIYEGTVCVIESQKKGDVILKKDLLFNLKCQKHGKVCYLEMDVQTDKNNREDLPADEIYLVNQHINLDKIYLSKLLLKIKKESPKEMLGFKPSKKDKSKADFYEKYFQELNSYGISLISIKQLLEGNLFDRFKTIRVKDIILIPSVEIPLQEQGEGRSLNKRKRVDQIGNQKHHIDFLINQGENPKMMINHHQYTDPNRIERGNKNNLNFINNNNNNNINNNNTSFINYNNNNINFINNNNNNDNNTNCNNTQIHSSYYNHDYISTNKTTSMINNVTPEYNNNPNINSYYHTKNKKVNINVTTFRVNKNDPFNTPSSTTSTLLDKYTNSDLTNILSNSKYSEILKEYLPSCDLTMKLNQEMSSLNINKITIFQNKEPEPILYYFENQANQYFENDSQSKFLTLSVKKNEIYSIDLKIKFDVPIKMVSLFSGHQNKSNINLKSKFVVSEKLDDPPSKKIMKRLKFMGVISL